MATRKTTTRRKTSTSTPARRRRAPVAKKTTRRPRRISKKFGKAQLKSAIMNATKGAAGGLAGTFMIDKISGSLPASVRPFTGLMLAVGVDVFVKDKSIAAGIAGASAQSLAKSLGLADDFTDFDRMILEPSAEELMEEEMALRANIYKSGYANQFMTSSPASTTDYMEILGV